MNAMDLAVQRDSGASAARAEGPAESPPSMSRLPILAWSLFLLVLPFFEGSGSPEGLLIAHLALLAAIAASARSIGPLSGPIALASGGILAAWGISGALGGYPFASLIAIVDLAAFLATLVVVEALCRARPDAGRSLPLVIGASGVVQAALVMVPWIASGFTIRGPGTLLNSNHTAAYLLLALWAIVAWRDGSSREADPGSIAIRRGGSTWEADTGVIVTRRGASAWDADSEAIVALSKGSAHGAPGAGGTQWREKIGGVSRLRWNIGLAGAIVLVASLLQASRGAFAGLIAGGVLFLALRSGQMKRRALRVSWGALIVVLVLGAGIVAHRLLTKADPFAWERVRLWNVALRVAQEHPILGVGPDVYGFVTAPFEVARRDWPVRFGKHVESTHSDPLRILAETGVVGAAAFLALLILVVRAAVRALRGSGRGVRESALAAALAGLLVQGVVENLSSRPAVFYTGALMAAILIAEGDSLRARMSTRSAIGSLANGHEPSVERTRGGGLVDGVDLQDAAQLRHAPEPSGRPGTAPSGRPGAETPGHGARAARVAAGSFRAVLLYGGLSSAALLLVIAPYLGHRAFTLFRKGGPLVGRYYASAIYWSPLHSDYRAALAEAVLAGRARNPADLRAGFLAIDDAIALKPIDPSYYVFRARLARQAFLAGPGEADWIGMADSDYARAIRLDPFRPQARLEHGWMVESLGKPAVALEDAELALRSEPNSFEARRLRAVSLLDLGRLEEARREAAEARGRHQDLAPFTPSSPYEGQVLKWDEQRWAEMEARLAAKFLHGLAPAAPLSGER